MFLLKKISGAFALLTFALLLGFPSIAQADSLNGTSEPDKYVQVRLITDQTQVRGGETIRIGLEQTIYPTWHTYWLNPGDSGTPTDIQWNLPEGASAAPLEWPTPKKLPYGPLTNYGYEGQVTLLQNLTLPDDIGTDPYVINASVNLLVCHDICIPETHDAFIVLNGDVAAEPQKIQIAENKLPVTQEWNAEFYESDGSFILDVQTTTAPNLTGAKNIMLAPEDWGGLDNTANAVFNKTDNGFQIIQKRGERDLAEFKDLPFVVSYQDQNGAIQSFRLETTQRIIPAVIDAPTSSITLWQALLFALFGGLILNLMPCVFPVLSLKALSLINLNDKEEKKARGYGLSYTAGILISFGVIAGILLALKAGGAQIGWGFQLQNPIIIILLTYLVFLMGLNLSGLFEFSGRLSNIGQGLTQKSGNRGAFFTGVLATLVATPCTAPFMGAAMGFALTQPAAISMLVFLTLGLGLALPYLALCFFPPLRAKLPRPGAWMETFRQFLAFPMFITAAWLVWVLAQQISVFSVFNVLLSLIAIAFVIWMVRVLPKAGIMRWVSILIIILSALFVTTATLSSAQINQSAMSVQEGEYVWEEFTPAALETALNESDNPVFTNMTAAWCITCKVNEKVALKTDKVVKLFSDKNITYFKGDWTNQNPDITQYLNQFDRQGVPLYVYYGARDPNTGQRPAPVVLPQIITAGLIEDTIQ